MVELKQTKYVFKRTLKVFRVDDIEISVSIFCFCFFFPFLEFENTLICAALLMDNHASADCNLSILQSTDFFHSIIKID